VSDLILHHYNESPYAEKIRTLLGYKRLRWQSVIVPRIAPKPDLTALTGGYRKVPVLQIGADVYCDTRLIAEVIEQHTPQPSARNQAGTFADIVEHWVDVNLFARVVTLTFGRNVDRLPEDLLLDRAALRGAPLEREALKQAVPLAAQELATQIEWLENGLASGPLGERLFVNGDYPGTGDFTLYSTLWFAVQGRFDFKPFPLVSAWFARMRAFGHGERVEISAAEALAVAARSAPVPLTTDSVSPDAAGVAVGEVISVTPEQLGHGTTVSGELLAINSQRLTLRVSNDRVPLLHVHFPRVGYRLRRTSASN